MLIDKLSVKLTSDYKSQRNSSDLVPLFKPLHAKTVSIIEMVKQYSSVNASQQATQRIADLIPASENKPKPKAEHRHARNAAIVKNNPSPPMSDYDYDSEYSKEMEQEVPPLRV